MPWDLISAITGTDYNELKVGSNGWVSFDNVANIASCFPTIPTPGGSGDNVLAPFMSDINFLGAGNPGECWYWTNNTDTMIVSYLNVPFWINSPPLNYTGSSTFQVILSAADSSITYMYGDMNATFNDNAGCASDISIGFENITGNIGLQFMTETIPTDNSAIKIVPPATPLITIPDATPFWNQNTDNKGNFELVNTPIDMTTDIKNVGNGDITEDMTIIGKLESLSFSLVWSDTVVVTGGLAVGADTMITFPKQATLTSEGQYYYTVITAVAGGEDANPSNNSNVTEINAPGCSGGSTIKLSYASPNMPDGSLVWSGGTGGIGVYFEPPVYPTSINSVDMFIRQQAFNPANNSAFDVIVYDDDAAPGLGTVLDSIHVGMGSYTPESEVNIPLSSPINVTSGGVYVAWMMKGDSVGIGTEAFGPISRRSYEILGSSWAEYRQSTVQEFFIGVNVDTAGYCILLGQEVAVDNTFELKAYPNPASNLANVQYTLPNIADVNITVTSIFGQTVANYTLTRQPAGINELDLNAQDLESGIYFIRMEANGTEVTEKLIIQK